MRLHTHTHSTDTHTHSTDIHTHSTGTHTHSTDIHTHSTDTHIVIPERAWEKVVGPEIRLGRGMSQRC